MTNRCFGLVSHRVQSLSRYFRSCSEPTAPLPCKSVMLWCHCSEQSSCGSNTQTRSQCQSRCCSRCGCTQNNMCWHCKGSDAFSLGALLRRPRLRAWLKAPAEQHAQHVNQMQLQMSECMPTRCAFRGDLKRYVHAHTQMYKRSHGFTASLR